MQTERYFMVLVALVYLCLIAVVTAWVFRDLVTVPIFLGMVLICYIAGRLVHRRLRLKRRNNESSTR